MTKIETAMHTLGKLARAIWPAGDIPEALLSVLLTRPASGLALMLKTTPGRHARASNEDVEALVAALPADLSDADDGVEIEDQGPFWIGWYQYLASIPRAKSWGPQQLERAGRLLYGERWQSELARALSVGDRRVREWSAGERRPSPGVWADIAALLKQRQQEGMALLAELDRE